MKVNDIFGDGWAGRLATEVNEGWVRKQSHPAYPLFIFNYTERAVYERHWNDVTLNTRGLIMTHDLHLVARPFPKFFNHGEPGAAVIPLDATVVALDKMDGSLGIIYRTPDGPAVATRGSFSSDQAIHATKVLRERYAEWAEEFLEATYDFPFTPLVEIVYPENRIVVDYGGQDDLVVLGAICHHSGEFLMPDNLSYPGPVTEVVAIGTFAEILALPNREGKEGVVVYNYDTEDRVKIKQEDYIRLHKIVTGLNARGVWEQIKDGKTEQEICDGLPDEFHAFVTTVYDTINAQFDEILEQIDEDFSDLIYEFDDTYGRMLGAPFDRKGFALKAQQTKYPWAMFMNLDNKDIEPKIWELVKPSADWNPHTRGGSNGS